MGVIRVTIWVIGVIHLLAKSPSRGLAFGAFSEVRVTQGILRIYE